MTDGFDAVAPVSNDPPATQHTNDSTPLSPRDAASALAKRRWESTQQDSGQERATREPAPEISREADAAPHDEAPGDYDQGTDREGDLPPIEPPRSWTKEQKERFSQMPRELQAYWSERAAEQERDFRQKQNEAAEMRKAAEAEARKAQQTRQQYEAQLPVALQAIQAAQGNRFPDIRTWDDVKRMAVEDPVRYAEWDVLRKQHSQARQAYDWHQQQRQHQEAQAFAQWAEQQDKAFTEYAKEFGDEKQARQAQDQVRSYMVDVLGFKTEELVGAWNSPNGKFHLRDAKVQKVLRDAAKWNAAEKAAKDAKTKPLPPVQRPGTSESRGERGASNIQALNQKLDSSGSAKDAARLLMAKRAAAARRSG